MFQCKGHHHIVLCEKNIKFVGSQPDGEPKRGYSDKVKTKTDSSCQSWYRIGILSDIEKTFHMINVDEKHRDALRFLWVKDIDSVDPKLLILRFIGVVFGLNCSPFILVGTSEHHISKYQFDDPYFAKKIY